VESYLDQRALTRIAASTDTAELERVYADMPYRDPAIDIVYRSRQLVLNPGEKAEKGLLETIPRNPLHLWYFYSITYTKAYTSSAELARIVNGYFEQLARIVLKRKDGYRDFLLLSRFADGEVASDLSDWNDFLKSASPEEFTAALRSLDQESRRRVCGDCAFLEKRTEAAAEKDQHDRPK
jgi:hypothetical protein